MSEVTSRRPGELVFALVIVVFAAAAFWQAYEISGFSGLSTPGIFPMLATITMVLSALCILRDTIRRQAAGTGKDNAAIRFFRDVLPVRLIAMLVLIGLYLAVMPWLGFLVASGLFLLASFALLWRRPLWQSVLLSVIALASVHFVFRTVFQVVLPQGSLLRGLF